MLNLNNIDQEIKYIERYMNDVSIEMVEQYYQSEQYISDCISEYAGNSIDIYTGDLLNWAKENIADIDYAVDEFGKPDSFIKYIEQGQYYQYDRQMYEDYEYIIKLSILHMIRDKQKETNVNLTNEQIEDIIESSTGNEESFEELQDLIECYFDDIEESEGE